MSDEQDRTDTPAGREPGGAGEAAGESRRDFIRKLPYVAPVIQSFVLADTVYGKTDKDKGGRGRGRGRGRVSAPGQNKPPPPPPGQQKKDD